jgi:hypothetical protein
MLWQCNLNVVGGERRPRSRTLKVVLIVWAGVELTIAYDVATTYLARGLA